MALDYDSGTGIFDRVGRIVRVANLIESFETGAGAGNVEKELGDLESEIEDTKEFDAQAMSTLLQQWATIKSTLDSMKVRITDLVEPTLQAEMVEAESLAQDDVGFLLDYLALMMDNDGESINASGISYVSPATASFRALFLLSRRIWIEGTVYNSERISNETFRVKLIKSKPLDKQVVRITGENPVGNEGDPDWDRSGFSQNAEIIAPSNKRNISANGDFETLNDAEDNFIGWTLSANVQVDSTNPYRGKYCAEFADNGTMSQLIKRSKIKKHTPYLLTVVLSRSVGADGTFDVTFDGTSYYNELVSTLATSWSGHPFFFGYIWYEEDQDPNDEADFRFELTGRTTGSVYVDQVGIYTFPTFLRDFGLILLQTSLNPSANVEGDLGITNDYAGVFSEFFNRYFDVNLPSNSAGSETILDFLAT